MSEEMAFPRDLLDELICSYCGSRFHVGLEVQSSHEGLRDGILRCDCYEYPVVCGIAVLRQISQVASTRNGAVDALRAQDPQRALLWLLGNGSATEVPGLVGRSAQKAGIVRLLGRVWELLRRGRSPLTDIPALQQSGFKAALQVARPRGYADYLFHRFANPSLLGAIPPVIVIGEHCREKSPGRVLDLLCGVGHTSATFCALWPELEVIGADSDFVNLFLAKCYLAPKMVAVCVDAEVPLPFSDSVFDGFFCLDGLHYVRSKAALLGEIDRILSSTGVWVFAHLHNATAVNQSPGVPLSAEGYMKRLFFGEKRCLAESEVLRQFQTEGCLDLELQPVPASLASSHALTMIGARTDSLWKKHPDLDKALCRRPDLIGFNPLYRVEGNPDGVMLRAAWPSESLHEECMGKMPALPESLRVPRHIVDEIRSLAIAAALPDDIRKLLRSFVLVGLPPCYSRPGLV